MDKLLFNGVHNPVIIHLTYFSLHGHLSCTEVKCFIKRFYQNIKVW